MSGNLLDFLVGRRSSDERREEARKTPERRTMIGEKHTVFGPTDIVEFWLRANCTEKFEMVLIDVSDDLERRDIEIMFHSTADRDLFRANLSQF